MIFDNNNKAIYLQIADKLTDEIFNGRYPADSRLPSVREYASDLQVNANTVMRSYDKLAQQGIIYNRRGIGFFVTPDAYDIILKEKAGDLMDNRLESLFDLLYQLGINPEMLKKQYESYLEKFKRPL